MRAFDYWMLLAVFVYLMLILGALVLIGVHDMHARKPHCPLCGKPITEESQ